MSYRSTSLTSATFLLRSHPMYMNLPYQPAQRSSVFTVIIRVMRNEHRSSVYHTKLHWPYYVDLAELNELHTLSHEIRQIRTKEHSGNTTPTAGLPPATRLSNVRWSQPNWDHQSQVPVQVHPSIHFHTHTHARVHRDMHTHTHALFP